MKYTKFLTPEQTESLQHLCKHARTSITSIFLTSSSTKGHFCFKARAECLLPQSARLHICKCVPHIESSWSSQMWSPQTMKETTPMCHSKPATGCVLVKLL